MGAGFFLRTQTAWSGHYVRPIQPPISQNETLLAPMLVGQRHFDVASRPEVHVKQHVRLRSRWNCFRVWPKAIITVAWGETPGNRDHSTRFGRRPYSPVRPPDRDYGLRPNYRMRDRYLGRRCACPRLR